MDTDNRVEELVGNDSGRAKAGAWHRLSGNFRVLRSWRPVRRAGAGIAAAAAAAVVVSMNGMMSQIGAVWWNAVIVAAGSVLAGLIVGSYLGAPIGVEATVCDTRWPMIGLTGLVIATSTGQGTLAAHLFTGAAPIVLAGVIQSAFAFLSLALLAWALQERLQLERTALTASTGRDAGDGCTSCRPLFPTKPGTSR
ncbi:hypothetical protein [Arthrobacter sp. 92]|uniref:hypothetical protein n=1 Tax=Arthrobacter sp. 92 TaxID=3418175 RepID=UPI003D070EAF